MPRNLNRRVEVVTPFENERLRRHLKDVFCCLLRDNVKGAACCPMALTSAPTRRGEEKFDCNYIL